MSSRSLRVPVRSSSGSALGRGASIATAASMRPHANIIAVAAEVCMAADTPAVVLGAGINGLGVARSLVRARVPVWLLDSNERRPEMYTRVAKPLAVPAMHGEALVGELERLGTARFSGLRPVLLLTQEETVKTISENRERLAPFYRFRLP